MLDDLARGCKSKVTQRRDGSFSTLLEQRKSSSSSIERNGGQFHPTELWMNYENASVQSLRGLISSRLH
jgi:hypothetical protein